MEVLVVNNYFWKDKRVLITGHTGFKGSWLSLWLQSLGANVVGYSLAPPTEPNMFEVSDIASGMTSVIGDIRDNESVKKLFTEHKPEIVFHLAAQSLVRHSYDAPVETYETNVMGTLSVLEAIRSVDSVRSAVMITTDKCYENKEWLWPYRENEPMGGHDPYSSSKGCAELLISSYRNSFFSKDSYSTHKTAIASARAGNVIGGGDWAKDRLIPDLLNAFIHKKRPLIRNPDAIRPWQHVLEPLSGYMDLAELLYVDGMEYAEAWNFGPSQLDAKSVEWIANEISSRWGDDAKWVNDTQNTHPHEASYLKLDSTKANIKLKWQPRWDIKDAITSIVDWHKAKLVNESMRKVSLMQIEAFSNAK